MTLTLLTIHIHDHVFSIEGHFTLAEVQPLLDQWFAQVSLNPADVAALVQKLSTSTADLQAAEVADAGKL